MPDDPKADTSGEDYALRLQALQQVWWKKALNVQAPYRWNIRRQRLGRTLDVGCGIGRNLEALEAGSVGVDHNAAAVEVARARGMTAVTTAEWESSPLRREGAFDGMLLAHVIEHLDPESGYELVRSYLPYLRPGGKVLFICPQEVGYASDPTHVRWTTGADLCELARRLGLEPRPWFSFPFPRPVGKVFIYNEFILVATKAG